MILNVSPGKCLKVKEKCKKHESIYLIHWIYSHAYDPFFLLLLMQQQVQHGTETIGKPVSEQWDGSSGPANV